MAVGSLIYSYIVIFKFFRFSTPMSGFFTNLAHCESPPSYDSIFGCEFEPCGPTNLTFTSALTRQMTTLVVSLTDWCMLRFIGRFDDRELRDFMEPLRCHPFGIKNEMFEDGILKSDYRVIIKGDYRETHSTQCIF